MPMKQLKKKEYEEFQQYLYNKAHGYIWTPDTQGVLSVINNVELLWQNKQYIIMFKRNTKMLLVALGTFSLIVWN